jgi:hypothetical protein
MTDCNFSFDCPGETTAIGDTSALVLLWCGPEIYRSNAVKNYAEKLDLRKGKELFNRCNAIWPDYGSVIRYRKLFIDEISESILKTGNIRQVIIPGAGFAMQGIELVSLFPDLTVFELDMNHMQTKQKLTAGLPFAAGSNLHCLLADIENSDRCETVLAEAGWKKNEPTLLIAEGISYYVSRKSVRRQWKMLAQGSAIIFEYLVPLSMVSPSRKFIPEKVFQEIISYCPSDTPLTHWSEQKLKKEHDVILERCCSLSDIERQYDPERRLFQERKDGWIEIAFLSRKN